MGRDAEFHAIDFFQRASWQSSTSPYHGWSPRKARKFLDRLLATIHRYDIRPIGFAYDIADFEALGVADRRRLTGATNVTRTRVHQGKVEITDKFVSSGAPTQPYSLGFIYFLTQALKFAPAGATVSYVFDQRKRSEAWAAESFEHIMRYSKRPEIKDRLGLLSFGDSAKYEPLQAADLYAYVWNRRLHESMNEDLEHALRKLGRKRDRMEIANAAVYRELLEDQDLKRTEGIMKALRIDDA